MYQAKSGFVHRKIAQVDVLISIGDNVADFNGYITLNETGAFLWDHLQTPQSPQALAQKLTEEFAVGYEQALSDVQELLQSLVSRGMVQEVAQ